MKKFTEEIDQSIFKASVDLVKKIFPLHRSISGDGIDQSFEILSKVIPLEIHKYNTGDRVLDWVIPQSWSCNKLSIIKVDNGKEIVSLDHPLRIASHSAKVNAIYNGFDLKKKMVISSKYPNNLMHRYYYYVDNWSISVTQNEFDSIDNSCKYRVVVDSKKYDGNLKVGESIILGKLNKKVCFLSHLCHPAQFNDGLVGVLLNHYLYSYLKKYKPNTLYSYNFLFLPETIGSIAYCSDNNNTNNTYFSIFSEMTALNQPLHIQRSLDSDDDVNKIIEIAGRDLKLKLKFSPFLKVIRNDEKVFNSPGIDIPSASITRAWGPGHKDHPFYGYHTDLDTIDNADLSALSEVILLYKYIIEIVENDFYVKRLFKGIPMLSRHKLFIDPLVDRGMYNKLESLVWALKDRVKISTIALELDIDFFKCLSILQDWGREGLVSLDID